MSEEVIRTTSGCNEAMMGSLLGSMANRNNNDPMAMAAMMNNSQWMNNPFIYLVFLMMFGRNGLWGNNENGLQDSEQCAYAGTLMLTTSKECVANEVRTISAQAEETLAKVDETRRKAETCKQLLEELDTAFKEKQQTEQRFQKIEERFGAIGEKMDKILKLIETKP